VKQLDPRAYQITVLAALLGVGLTQLRFEVTLVQVAVTFAAALATQVIGARLAGLRDVGLSSALISSLSLCLLLRTSALPEDLWRDACAALPFLAPHFRSRILLGAQIVYGVLAVCFAAVNYGVLPVMATVNAPDQTSAWAYGWDEVADAVKRLKSDNDVGFVGATDYALASPLAFALHDRDVTSVSPHRDGYDDWFDPEAHRGQTAIIVADYWRQLDAAFAAQFRSVEVARRLDVTRFGKVLDHYTIYIGRGFSPATQPGN